MGNCELRTELAKLILKHGTVLIHDVLDQMMRELMLSSNPTGKLKYWTTDYLSDNRPIDLDDDGA
jgi:hypothetical protein